jgi:hypothetical protein
LERIAVLKHRTNGALEWARWILTTKSLDRDERNAARVWFRDTYGMGVDIVLAWEGRAA